MEMPNSFRGKPNVWKDVKHYPSRKSCRKSITHMTVGYFTRCIAQGNLWLKQKRRKAPKKRAERGRPKGSGFWKWDENRNYAGTNPDWRKYQFEKDVQRRRAGKWK